jgi:phosphatidate cytidylyltransferase
MGARELTAFAILPLVVAGIALLPPWVYLAAVWFIGMLAAWELLVILGTLAHPVPRTPTLVGLGVALPATWWLGLPWAAAVPCSLVVLLPLAYLLGHGPTAGASAGIGGAVFTACYYAVTGGAMGLLRLSVPDPVGWRLVLTTCLVIWAGDSGAYYVGSRFGRHKLAPRVSPKKSWEGIAGGVLGTAFGVWFCRTVFFPQLQPLLAIAMVVLLSVLAPLGDLVESLFKRDAGVKDSSSVIPGHGGFLDRTDSLFFVAPFVLALALAAGLAP